MKIKQLQLQNYGRFEDLTIDFAPTEDRASNVTVIVGNNGAGKSQILQALATGLSWFLDLFKGKENKFGSSIDISQINNKFDKASIEISLLNRFEKSLNWSVTTVRDRLPNWTSSNLQNGNNLDELFSYYIRDYELGLISSLPLIVYYSDSRDINHQPFNWNESFTTNILTGYENALSAGLSYNQFFQWFRDIEDIENETILLGFDKQTKEEMPYLRNIQLLRLEEQYLENQLEFSEGLDRAKIYTHLGEIKEQIFHAEQEFERITKNLDDYKATINYQGKPSLNAVRKSIEYFTEFKNPRIRRQGTPTMIVEKDGEELDVNQLSQGEKSLLALVGDIARRLAILNPSLDDPLQGEGVVMIDEVDLHLHPKWQHDLIDKLVRTFPNVQFILTTHSPLIVSDSPNILVYSLENGNLHKTKNIYGEDANTLLNNIFDVPVRTPEVENDFNNIRRAISNQEFEIADNLINSIAKKVASGNTELLKVKLLLAQAKLAQKSATNLG
ncbi:AAA family ATPase [Moraxella osloensis]|uniref:AAA family ATPase n=1 Tax=Faucicola osloensis TaxID=34062 RepID=UPI0020034E31|nr:AAA family ATPase [Moraxella osloensis]MCK6053189.1 AAA family ATPase [Moraxella osloensis]